MTTATKQFRSVSGSFVAAAAALSLVSCASPSSSIRAPVMGGAPSTAAAGGKAYQLAMLTTACWFGGQWADAEGSPVTVRKAVDRDRCDQVVEQVYGRMDRARRLRLRALDARVVDEVVGKVGALAAADPADMNHGADLVKLLRSMAGAQRENMYARRAADKVKRDLDGRRPDKLARDERAAEEPLLAHAELEALLQLEAGELTHDAHVLGTLAALDRMDLIRGLPRHLKVLAVENAFGLLFGTPAPVLPSDPAVPLQRGLWLSYLATAARTSGFAVPDAADIPRARNRLAWAGVLEGFATRLRADIDLLSSPGATTLRPIARNVIERLERVYRTSAWPQGAPGRG
jgi:hypothetical protein